MGKRIQISLLWITKAIKRGGIHTQEQQLLPMWVPFLRGLGDPYADNLAPTHMTTHRETVSRNSHRKKRIIKTSYSYYLTTITT